MSEPVKVKPWWQSVSLWISIAVAIGAVLTDLVAQGVVKDGVWVAAVLAIVNVLKRGAVEAITNKANAISGVVKDTSTNP